MQTFIALLRGINVSGKNKIRMQELKGVLEKAGFANVRTYIQSGNIVFESVPEKPVQLAAEITDAIRKTFSYDVPAVVFDSGYLRKVISSNPFTDKPGTDASKLLVTFLDDEPTKENTEEILRVKFPPDEIMPADRAFYLFCPDGFGRSKYTINFFEKRLGVTATTRNWRTCNILLEMAMQK